MQYEGMKGARSWHETSAEHGVKSCRGRFPSTCTITNTRRCSMYPIYLKASINHITSPHFTSLGTSVAARWQLEALSCPRDLLLHHASDLYMYTRHLFLFIPKREPSGRRCEWTAPGHMISFLTYSCMLVAEMLGLPEPFAGQVPGMAGCY